MPCLGHSCLRNLMMAGTMASPYLLSTSALRTASTARRDARSSYSGYVSNSSSRRGWRSVEGKASRAVMSASASRQIATYSLHAQLSSIRCCTPDSSEILRFVELVMRPWRISSRFTAFNSASPFTAMSFHPHEWEAVGKVGGWWGVLWAWKLSK
jgi:hypothetical protein